MPPGSVRRSWPAPQPPKPPAASSDAPVAWRDWRTRTPNRRRARPCRRRPRTGRRSPPTATAFLVAPTRPGRTPSPADRRTSAPDRELLFRRWIRWRRYRLPLEYTARRTASAAPTARRSARAAAFPVRGCRLESPARRIATRFFHGRPAGDDAAERG